MHIDKRMIDSIKRDPILKKSITSTNNDVMTELGKMFDATKIYLEGCQIEKTANWMLYKNLWLQAETGNLLSNSYRTYSRGDVIMSVDLGTINMGTEIRYPHPCVVLYDEIDWIVVVPITAASLDKNGTPIIHPFEVFTDASRGKPTSNEFFFSKPSVAQVDQIQRIGKDRIINKNRYKLRIDLLNQIDNIVVEKLAPQKHKLLERLKQTLIDKDNKINELQEIINTLNEK